MYCTLSEKKNIQFMHS